MCPRGQSRHLWAQPRPLSTAEPVPRSHSQNQAPQPHLSHPPREGREVHPVPCNATASAQGNSVVRGPVSGPALLPGPAVSPLL